MRVPQIILCLLVGSSIHFNLWAQNPTLAKFDFTSLLEAIYQHQVEEVYYERLKEVLWDYYHQPLFLNQASREELASLAILTEAQIDHLVDHATKNGPLISIYELQAIPTFDQATIALLLPFVYVEEMAYTYPQGIWHRMVGKNSEGLIRYERTVEPKKGYQASHGKRSSRYVGSPYRMATRWRLKNPNDFSIGFSAKKDAGEALTWDPATKRYGFDFWSFHYLLQNKKRVKALIIGDYQIGYGQGLINHAGFAMNKSSEPMKIMRTNNLGIRPYTSLMKFGFLRGIATTLAWQQWELTTYYAYNYLDARLQKDPVSGRLYTEGIRTSYNHKTLNQVYTKATMAEQVVGSTVVYQNKAKDFQLGINTLYNHYHIPIKPKEDIRYRFHFRGKENSNLSLFYKYLWQNYHFFGEAAVSKSGGKALVTGILASLSAQLDMAMLLRHYEKNFHTPYGNAFRASSKTRNETGLYVALKFKPIKKFCIGAYYDVFKFPGPQYYVKVPSQGYDARIRITHQWNKYLLLGGQWRLKGKAKKVPWQPKIGFTTKHTYAFWIDQRMGALSLHSKLQWSKDTFLGKAKRGYALVQDVGYKVRKISARGRIAFFQTSSESRLYFYEKNVRYTFSYPFYSGNGIRYYLWFRYKFTPSWQIGLRYAQTHYMNKKKIGSGLEEVDGNTKTDITLQVLCKF